MVYRYFFKKCCTSNIYHHEPDRECFGKGMPRHPRWGWVKQFWTSSTTDGIHRGNPNWLMSSYSLRELPILWPFFLVNPEPCCTDHPAGVTHSICTLEFENHRALYDWFLESWHSRGALARKGTWHAVSPGLHRGQLHHHSKQTLPEGERWTGVMICGDDLLPGWWFSRHSVGMCWVTWKLKITIFV